VSTLHPKQWLSIPGVAVNEDGGGVRPDLAWLLDGATGLVQERLLPGGSDAQWLVSEACSFFERRIDTQRPIDGGRLIEGERRATHSAAFQLLSALSEFLTTRFQAALLRPQSPDRSAGATADGAEAVPSAGLALAMIDGPSLTIANIGDCKTLVRFPSGALQSFGDSPVTALDAQVVGKLIDLQRSRPDARFTDLKRELAPLIKHNRRLKNQPNGYGVLEPGQSWLQHVQYFTLEAAPGTHVLMLTDGFYRLVDHYHLYTDESLASAAIDEGLESLACRLRRIESDDPECRAYPRLKPQDDATAQLLYLASGSGGIPK
jgi:hypothetical protein